MMRMRMTKMMVVMLAVLLFACGPPHAGFARLKPCSFGARGRRELIDDIANRCELWRCFSACQRRCELWRCFSAC